MTMLYVPRLIESAEQAEALPIGTVAFETGDQGQAVGASVRVRDGWHCAGYCFDFGGAEVLKHSDMIGDTALVPIEAEEQWGVEVCEEGDPGDTHVIRAVSRENAEWRLGSIGPLAPGWARIVNRTTATPWEDAS